MHACLGTIDFECPFFVKEKTRLFTEKDFPDKCCLKKIIIINNIYKINQTQIFIIIDKYLFVPTPSF